MDALENPLERALLDVPLRITCDDRELRARLELCYAAFAPPVSRMSRLEARLDVLSDAAEARYRIAIDGRDERRESTPVEAVRAFNHELLQAVMARARERYYVHAAVVAWNGRALVIPGLSRAGKSTLALALVLAGARFLSDEILAVDPKSGRAVPFPRALKIRDECVGYFPELATAFEGAGEGRFLPFTALGADVLARETPIAAVVIPRWGAELAPNVMPLATTVTPLARGPALLALAEASLNFGAHRAASLDFLTGIAREAKAFTLTWREPRAAASALLEELDW